MLKATVLVIGVSASAVFYGIRSGRFGVTKVSFVDTKERTNFVYLNRTPFYDELHYSTTDRVTALLHYRSDFGEICAPLSKSGTPLVSFKPIEYERVYYDKRGELEKKLSERFDAVQRQYQDQPYETRELIAKESLTRLVSEFDK